MTEAEKRGALRLEQRRMMRPCLQGGRCIYVRALDNEPVCDYIGITGTRRPCPHPSCGEPCSVQIPMRQYRRQTAKAVERAPDRRQTAKAVERAPEVTRGEPPRDKMAEAAALKAWMREQGLSVRAFGERCGRSESAIIKWRRGEVPINLAAAAKGGFRLPADGGG